MDEVSWFWDSGFFLGLPELMYASAMVFKDSGWYVSSFLIWKGEGVWGGRMEHGNMLVLPGQAIFALRRNLGYFWGRI